MAFSSEKSNKTRRCIEDSVLNFFFLLNWKIMQICEWKRWNINGWRDFFTIVTLKCQSLRIFLNFRGSHQRCVVHTRTNFKFFGNDLTYLINLKKTFCGRYDILWWKKLDRWFLIWNFFFKKHEAKSFV